MAEACSATLTVWRLVDGKPGHEKQSQALVEGLVNQRPVQTQTVPVGNLKHTLRALITGRWPELNTINAVSGVPDVVIGAGHATHLALLAMKRVYGAKAVVIMNPSLPSNWFDAVITPAHDGLQAGGNRLVSATALAPTVLSDPNPNLGLILLGGTNKHFAWPEPQILEAVNQLVTHQSGKHWLISNSRRTPNSTSNALNTWCQQHDDAEFISVDQCPPGWLAEQLTKVGEIWITKDSASMVAEALNTQAGVGLIDLPLIMPGTANKIAKAAQGLVDAGEVGVIASDQYNPAPPRSAAANHHLTVGAQLLALLGL
ncbi:mitochondrial fission ELM1 family protein [Halioxenophilus aromaticivorans]|uniref:Nucleoside-diphosphate sugar epimerase n=1 Tax=Halioxenophilus aromaticivorans TaxID=1306992 RepID=A0AAV3U226_9ALTE